MAGEARDYHFFSDFARKQVTDAFGTPAGAIEDLALDPAGQFPRATHLVLRRGFLRRRYAAVPWEKVEGAFLTIHLRADAGAIAFGPERPAFDFTLVRDVLDQQVVDTSGQKVIRVNDVQLLQLGCEFRVSAVDVGIRGIVRRLGWQWWADPFAEAFLARTDYLKDNIIAWSYVQPLAMNPQKGTLRLTVRQKELALIPEADFGELLDSLDPMRRAALFGSVAPDLRPKVFSDLGLERQRELLENMDLQEAAALLSRVPADQTTDLLEELPAAVSRSILAAMETTHARRLSALLGYTSDSAGGLMTTELLTAPHSATVAEAVERLKAMEDQLDRVSHLYLVDGGGRLMGQVPIKRLILASPADPVAKLAYPKPVYVRASDSLREVAFVVDKYRFPAVPVVNNGKERLLQGVISVDDILARVIPIAWKRRRKAAA